MSSFTSMNLTVCDKRLEGTVTYTHNQKSEPEFQFEPFKFSTRFPVFHIPGKLTMKFETTDNIFNKNVNLENSLHFIKSLLSEWLGNLMHQYQQQLKSWNKLVGSVYTKMYDENHSYKFGEPALICQSSVNLIYDAWNGPSGGCT